MVLIYMYVQVFSIINDHKEYTILCWIIISKLLIIIFKMFMAQTSRPTSDFLVVILRLHLNARIDCQYIQFTYFYTLNIKKD